MNYQNSLANMADKGIHLSREYLDNSIKAMEKQGTKVALSNGLVAGTIKLGFEANDYLSGNYEQLPNGDYFDVAAQKIIKGPIDIGHAYGWEHRRLSLAAKELGWSQQQLNDYVNARPENFRLENMSRNRSHIDEMPGNDQILPIKRDMLRFEKESK